MKLINSKNKFRFRRRKLVFWAIIVALGEVSWCVLTSMPRSFTTFWSTFEFWSKKSLQNLNCIHTFRNPVFRLHLPFEVYFFSTLPYSFIPNFILFLYFDVMLSLWKHNLFPSIYLRLIYIRLRRVNYTHIFKKLNKSQTYSKKPYFAANILPPRIIYWS